MTDPLPRLAGAAMLRRLAPSDLAAFQAYRHDAELGRYQGWAPVPDDDAREFLRHMGAAELLRPGTWCQIGIAQAVDAALIGDIGLLLSSDATTLEIGFTLRRESQGQGLATLAVAEAIAMVFEHTPAQRVIGIADVRNLASTRLLERLGMAKIETRTVISAGEPCTEHVYAIGRHPIHTDTSSPSS
ncbi:GNAT family N-acetyltransferase [Luteimonas sp. MC1572]|uniref:GNAT family N-acetyltransferase n=2 Tax=Luteimonas sp. MC1572 TaxID=2799325 RepID=UPI0018F0B4DD|nr:GNAT family N-acetyltransferase [Luteimonas sp. MC1572]MBJ6982156.1 GNAT family N-acetyltransferase [Luteimonas sp. MC1572]